MSWKRANAAGAKPVKGNKSAWGICAVSGCSKGATMKLGKLKVCRDCYGELNG